MPSRNGLTNTNNELKNQTDMSMIEAIPEHLRRSLLNDLLKWDREDTQKRERSSWNPKAIEFCKANNLQVTPENIAFATANLNNTLPSGDNTQKEKETLKTL